MAVDLERFLKQRLLRLGCITTSTPVGFIAGKEYLHVYDLVEGCHGRVLVSHIGITCSKCGRNHGAQFKTHELARIHALSLCGPSLIEAQDYERFYQRYDSDMEDGGKA